MIIAQAPTFFMLLLLPLLITADKCSKDDKRALLSIKSSLNNAFPTWISAFACCDWYGIECDPGVFGNSAGSRVTSLSILTDSDLTWNSLSGPIPSFLSQLTSVKIIDLSFNLFSGTIPPQFVNLPSLIGLDLSRNRLTGPIPSEFGNFNISSLPILILSHNSLSGNLPVSLGQPQWYRIDLSRNNLTGDASFLFGAEKSTSLIDLSRNEFAFDLSHVSFPVNLSSLDLNHNMITGSIPAQINQLKTNFMSLFNVSYNRLCGEIPAGPITAKFGADAYFHNKCLCGSPLPPCTKG